MYRKFFAGALALMLAALYVQPAAASATVITVTTTADNTTVDSFCSLREAVGNANSGTVGNGDCLVAGGAETRIEFNIVPDGIQTITMTTILSLTAADTTIDGTTEPNCFMPCITLDAAGGSFDMLSIQGDRDTVMGMGFINASGGSGLTVTADHDVVKKNYIGTNGIGPQGNSEGISIFNATNATIGGSEFSDRNIISGNGTGINISSTASNVSIKGNIIGTNQWMDGAIPNSTGILVNGAAGVTIGGTATLAEYNVIAGNNGDGISATNSASVTIAGNYIGTDPDMVEVLPNGADGAGFAAVAIRNGATAKVAGNVIANHTADDYSILMFSGVSGFQAGSVNNCLLNNPGGVSFQASGSAVFDNNWWGSASGPTNATNNPSGTGDPADDNVIAVPFLTVPPAICESLYPKPPALSAPRNGAALTKAAGVKLTWKGVKGATGYHVEYDDAADFASPIDSVDTTAPNFTTPLLSYGVYYWHVAATTASGTSGYSLPFSFEMTLNKTPAKNAQVKTHLVKFSWAAEPGATQYQLEVFNSSTNCLNGTSAVLDKTVIKPAYSMVTPTDTPLAFGSYYWRVHATLPSPGNFTPCSRFDVSTLSAPKNGSLTTKFLPRFTWGKDSLATSYALDVRTLANDGTTSPFLTRAALISPSYTALVGDNFTYGRYLWNITETGSPFILPTPDFTFDITNMSKPANHTFTVDSTPTFSWGKVTGATFYRVEITTLDDPNFDHWLVTLNANLTLKQTLPDDILPHGSYLWRVTVDGSTNYEMPPWVITIGP